jgi:hypothetical protein
VILHRPVGKAELDLVLSSGVFPPRLPHQPVFYPVIDYDYAVEIARDWNARQNGEGHVLRFEVDDAFIARYIPAEAGGRTRREYWIPAEDLDRFNKALLGPPELVASFRKEP